MERNIELVYLYSYIACSQGTFTRARYLVEIIHTMLSRGQEFIDIIDSLTEKKIENMSIRAKNPIRIQQLEATMRQWIAKKYGKDHEWKREQNS